MKVPIRTLTQRDVDILARSSFFATVTKGYVEHHDLRWGSPSLIEWMLRQQNLRRSRKVEVLIDELDLSEVFVMLPAEDDRAQVKLRALSTQPQYTKNLSLYEHEKLKAAIKAKHLNTRLVRMEDGELLRLRTEYYALLGRQGDPISTRRLEKLRDQLAERRHSRTAGAAITAVTPKPEIEEIFGTPPLTPDTSSFTTQKRKRSRPAPKQPSVGPEPAPSAPPVVLQPEPENIQEEAPLRQPENTRTDASLSPKTPTYSYTRIKRKHR